MRLLDCRDQYAAIEPHDDRTYLVLATDMTVKFRWGGGNQAPWSALEPMLQRKLPGGFHEGLGDVSVGADAGVQVDARCGGDEAAAWFARELVARNMVPPSAPVTLVYPDGRDRALGTAGDLAASTSWKMAA